MSPNLLAQEAALAWGLVLEVECELKRQYGLAGLRLSVSALHWLYRGEFPVPVSIGRAEPPDRHRHRAVIKGRKGQHLELQLRSLSALAISLAIVPDAESVCSRATVPARTHA